MKELSIEEKAKRYDRAIEKARNIVNSINVGLIGKDSFEAVFPELAESENERIRKWIRKELESKYVVDNIINNVMADKALAWLEKQGEQKPSNKTEPKFKVGDWIFHERSGNTFHINRIDNRTYISDENATISFGRQNDWRLWTIQDAKAGDVLATEDWVFIFKKMNSNEKPTCYCHYDIELGFRIDTNSYIATGSEIYPATKEQRDTLMKAMADAGYTFDFEKKELKKIEQNTAWSEEDETKIKSIIALLKSPALCAMDGNKGIIDESIKYLKSLKERYTWKPSEDTPKWRRLPLNGVSYPPDKWCVMDIVTSTVNGNNVTISALVKGDYYVPLYELDKFINKEK